MAKKLKVSNKMAGLILNIVTIYTGGGGAKVIGIKRLIRVLSDRQFAW